MSELATFIVVVGVLYGGFGLLLLTIELFVKDKK